MREAAIAGVSRTGDHILGGRIMQRVVHPRDHARGVAKRRMHCDVFNALAVNVYLAIVAQAFQIFLAGHGPHIRLDRCRLWCTHRGSSNDSNAASSDRVDFLTKSLRWLRPRREIPSLRGGPRPRAY